MSDLCEVLRNFEESTQMVIGDNVIRSITIPLLCLLKRSLLTIKADALYVKEVEMGEEELTQRDSQSALTSSSMRELEEEEEETVASTTEGTFEDLISLQRGWAEEE